VRRGQPEETWGGLASRLGWEVRDKELLAQALSHRSWCSENLGRQPNERLEFLGDAVLGLVVADYLYRNYPELSEGEMAKARAAVVNTASLAAVAGELELGEALLLGKGEDATGGRRKPSILADSLEAVIGAVYLDAGYPAAEAVVLRLFSDRAREAASGPGEDDYKTRLQELCAQANEELPTYRLSSTGPDHAKVFRAEVFVAGRLAGAGVGRSKKEAEQMAARQAWGSLARPEGAGAAGGSAPGAEAAPAGGLAAGQERA
jgi:ribonuclease-3